METSEIFLRLGIAAALGVLLGLNRDRCIASRPAYGRWASSALHRR